MSEKQTKKGRCSSWLTKAASYGAEPVEPVPKRFSRLVKNPKFGQEVIKEENNNNRVWPLFSTPKQYNLHIKGKKR